MPMSHFIVFREEGITLGQSGRRYGHNERCLDSYNNGNINFALSGNNYYFKKPNGTYEEMFQIMLEKGEISTKGLKKDGSSKVLSEIIVGVNREYWQGKSQEEIIRFFKAAYDYIESRFGKNQILSAVIHADEVSDEKISYHMHVIAIPTTEERKRYYTKRSKEYRELAEKVGEKNIKKNDPRLLKSTERQVGRNRFFESTRDEQHRITYSYSVWQDEILKAVKAAGFTDIHRGNANQKAVHLHPAAYKNIMERIKSDADGLLPDIKPQVFDENNYLVSKEVYDTMVSCKEEVEKQTATYNLAVQALMEEQVRVFNRQNEIYQVSVQQKCIEADAEELKELREQADALQIENGKLKKLLEYLQDKVYQICQSFVKMILFWVQLRTDREADVNSIIQNMDEEVRNGITILNNENKQEIAVPVK